MRATCYPAVEVFDEADLDAALARFDELQPQAPRLENAASQVEQRFSTCFAARDWDAMAELLSDNILTDDRRHIVNAGVMRGRDAEIASERAIADVGVTNMTPTMLAIRGGRLALGCYSIFDGWSGTKVLCVSEINAENQIVARVVFDSDDIDAAFTELDARYLAGEAAAHAHTWSVMQIRTLRSTATSFPKGTGNTSIIGERQRLRPSDLTAFLSATWDLIPDLSIHIEAVHRLSNVGVVVTHAVYGTSHDGLRCRVADDRSFHGRRRPGHPLRAIRRGRPRCRARAALTNCNRRRGDWKTRQAACTTGFRTRFAARDWVTISARGWLITSLTEDRRRVVNAWSSTTVVMPVIDRDLVAQRRRALST